MNWPVAGIVVDLDRVSVLRISLNSHGDFQIVRDDNTLVDILRDEPVSRGTAALERSETKISTLRPL